MAINKSGKFKNVNTMNNIKTILKKSWFIALIVLALVNHACQEVDPIIEELEFPRAFSPLELDVKVRNQVNAEIDWTVAQSVDHYMVEIHNDSLAFGSLVITQEVMPGDVPVTIALESEEQYSVRVKAISSIESQDESKWSGFAFSTDKENLFLPLADENIGKRNATLNWIAGSEVTHFMITPGDVKRDLTADEIAAGEATITDLTFDTEYTVIMYNGTNPKQRGNITFTTLPAGTTITPADDLFDLINNAPDDEVFLLEGGDYSISQGSITINKSITLKGLTSDDMPILHAQFVLADGAANVRLESLELNGNYIDTEGAADVLAYAVQYSSESTAVGDLEVINCVIHDYTKSLIAAGSGEFTTGDILFEDCLVSNIFNDGGDFIDFRKSFPKSITLNNSIFSNCATVNTRDFIRLDGNAKGNAFDDGINTPVITINSCTMYNVMNSSSSTKRLFYVRWQNAAEVLSITNSLFVDMGLSVVSNQSDTDMPTFNNNNYFNAAGYFDDLQKVYDNSGNHLTEDPGFADPANNDFTITNQTLLDNNIGARQ